MHAPIPMILYCPNCGEQHIDKAEHDLRDDYAVIEGVADLSPGYTPWTNPPHRSHLCHECGMIWRPADVCTVGVASIATEGKNDIWVAYPEGISAQPAKTKGASNG